MAVMRKMLMSLMVGVNSLVINVTNCKDNIGLTVLVLAQVDVEQ